MSIELWISRFPLSLNVIVYTHVSLVVFTRILFFLFLVVESTLLRTEHVWMPGRISQA
jgi:hypothetical protein